MQRISSALLLLAGLLVTTSASADTLSVEGVEVGAAGEDNSVSIHYFSVSEADVVGVHVDGAPWWDADHITTQVYLFDAGGNALAGGISLDGSGDVSFSKALAAGEYMIAVGDAPLSPKEAWNGANNPSLLESWGIARLDGKYDLTVTADTATLAWTGGDGTAHAVPELSANSGGAALMLLLGGMVLMGQRRRRFVA